MTNQTPGQSPESLIARINEALDQVEQLAVLVDAQWRQLVGLKADVYAERSVQEWIRLHELGLID